MDEISYLKLVPPVEKKTDQEKPPLDPLVRFKRVVLNLTQNGLDCLDRVSKREMKKSSPSPSLMEEYFLLHHNLDFIKRLCETKK